MSSGLSALATSLLGLLPCPRTHWDAQQPVVAAPTRSFLHTVTRPADVAPRDERAWIADRRHEFMALLDECGAVHFRGLESSRTQSGFREFCDALPLQPCYDPLSSIGVRSLLSARRLAA